MAQEEKWGEVTWRSQNLKDFQRYSFNDVGNFFRWEWQELYHDAGLKRLEIEVIRKIMRGEPVVHAMGGDCCRGNATRMQRVDSDGGSSTKVASTDLIVPDWVALSLCVEPTSRALGNGPFYFVGKEAMYRTASAWPLQATENSVESLDALYGLDSGCLDMMPGDILVRNPLVWHCGTINVTGKSTYLPGLVWKVHRGMFLQSMD